MTAGLGLISLDLIRLDEAVWPRSSFDHARIDDFAALYKLDGLEALPPVVIVGDGAGQYLLCDGHHRLAALYALGAPAVPTRTEAISGGLSPGQFAFEYAVESAARTAKPLTRAERNDAVERLLEERDDLSDRRIAELCGVSHQTVCRRRARCPVDHPSQMTPTPVARSADCLREAAAACDCAQATLILPAADFC